MPRQKGVSQLETLRRKQAEIAEQLKAAEARQRERAKQVDARRKELVGDIVVEHLTAEPDSALTKSVMELLNRKLMRPGDRGLFPELPPIAGGRKTGKARS